MDRFIDSYTDRHMDMIHSFQILSILILTGKG